MDNPNCSTEHKKYQHLSSEERHIIEVRFNEDKWTIYTIAKSLGRPYNTIKNEINRGTVYLYNGKIARYKADKGEEAYREHRKNSCRNYRCLKTTKFLRYVSEFQFHIPHSEVFTYDSSAKTQIEMKRNVYQNYLSSAEPRSSSERKFEKFCEHSDSVEWWYKNGDKGNDYLSIVYRDNSGKQKLFYPDYLVGVNSEIWIIETKGGFDRSGNSQDIDIFSPKKFDVLKTYLDKHSLKGGFVRNDDKSDELCICTDNYSDDINSDSWRLLSDLLP